MCRFGISPAAASVVLVIVVLAVDTPVILLQVLPLLDVKLVGHRR